MKPDLQRRVAYNEDTFREVNEGIARGLWPGEEDSLTSFRCECARLGCNQMIELKGRDYERIRSHPRRFVVAVGHELPATETVVERGAGYLVVEKRGEAGREAQSLDPRT
jgi:hypothetical protein